MPPRAKFTKEEIVDAALKIVRESGIKNLTARNLAAELNSSPRPIFTLYRSMEEVLNDTIDAIYHLYLTYIDEGLKSDIKFKGTGQAYIQFAIDEPKFFQTLFMHEQENDINVDHILETIDKDFQKELDLIINEYHVTNQQAKELYTHLWIFSHGIATLCATRVCSFTPQQISDLLSDAFIGQIKKITKGI